ncbi:MAG: hypothetical protein K5872_14590 [Rhizobiaceae bacterium]|nr:hypothetical protein [Rhizobiaceae bacterium]MCV0407449.1 hypothetical protein [Rhizobiaceae bacterium]
MEAAHARDPLEAAPQPRPASLMMQPERLAAIQPSRLSVTRALMNRMLRERWDISVERFDVDAAGEGTVAYSIRTPRQEFSFIAFSRPPSRKARTGRIIGQAWDMMGTLNEGPVTEDDIASARTELPKLYRGRATPNALVWCRANRSMRIFDRTLAALASGGQPPTDDLAEVCYLMRNTGLDGNGTFGTRPFPSLGSGHDLGGPLQAQMLTAYLMREYSCDLVEHLARLQSDRAVPLDPAIRRYLGVGNGSALGLIFFVHRHPKLIGSWMSAREEAIARARGLELGKGDPRINTFIELVRRAITFRRQDRMHYETFASSVEVADDLEKVAAALVALRETGLVDGRREAFPLDALAKRFEQEIGLEALETFLSLLIELVPENADALAAGISGADEMTVAPAETCADLARLIRGQYGWALETDMSSPEAYRYIWYKSESAEEPRRGAREEVPDALDLGLDLCGGLQGLVEDLDRQEARLSVARFLMKHPEHRYLTARVQTLRDLTYHTPMANINAEDFTPIHLVRLMNAGIHGIDKTRDFLRRNLRGVLYHGAPTPDDIRAGREGVWAYPAEPRS